MSKSDLEKFHSSYVANKKKRICIVGDKTQIDIEKLKEMGSFKEIKSNDIFSQ